MAGKQDGKNDEAAEQATKVGRPADGRLSSFKATYGPKEGERVFRAVSIAGGFGDLLAGSHEHVNPSIDLSGVKGDNLKAVEEVFASAKAAKE